MKAWYFLRSLIFAAGQFFSLIFFTLFGLLLFPFSHRVRYQFMHYWARFLLVWVRWTCGVSYKVHGLENVDKSQAGLILARHESAWETFATQAIFPRQAFVLKKELLKIPFFGWGMAMLNPIAIDRNAGRQALKQILAEGQERLSDGIWVIIFPEGTRMPAGELGKINAGGAMLALKAQQPVYLMAHNAGEYWPKNSFIKTPGEITVHISPKIDVADMTLAQLNQLTEEWFLQHLSHSSGAKTVIESEEMSKNP